MLARVLAQLVAIRIASIDVVELLLLLEDVGLHIDVIDSPFDLVAQILEELQLVLSLYGVLVELIGPLFWRLVVVDVLQTGVLDGCTLTSIDGIVQPYLRIKLHVLKANLFLLLQKMLLVVLVIVVSAALGVAHLRCAASLVQH